MGEITNQVLNAIVGVVGLDVSPDSTIGYVVAALIQCVLLLHVIAVGALVFIWLERKVAGRIQDRLGPTRVGGKFGWLQTLADGIKLLAKEDVMPKDADPLLFKIAPYVSMGASFAAYVGLPFSDGWVAQHVNSAVFFVVAVLGLEVFGVILAGYASGSKWSLFGAMREAAQVVSYEVPLGLCVVIPVFICGTMNLVTIANMQAGWFTNWLIFHDPFTFAVFWVYFTCAVASVNRAPFDLAEAESELVAGFHTEYSGLRWSFFFMAEYGSMFTVAGLAAILFFGGWNGPIPIFDGLIVGGLSRAFGWLGFSPAWQEVAVYIGNLAGCVNFILKTVVGVTVMMWVRWTLPRLRIDQVMTTCLKYCVPIAAVCFLGAVGWQVGGLPSVGGAISALAGAEIKPYRVRENWVAEQALLTAEGRARDSSRPDAGAAAGAHPAAGADRTEGGPAPEGESTEGRSQDGETPEGKSQPRGSADGVSPATDAASVLRRAVAAEGEPLAAHRVLAEFGTVDGLGSHGVSSAASGAHDGDGAVSMPAALARRADREAVE